MIRLSTVIINVPDIGRAAEFWCNLGARRVDWPRRDDIVVLEDPNGFRFCVIC